MKREREREGRDKREGTHAQIWCPDVIGIIHQSDTSFLKIHSTQNPNTIAMTAIQVSLDLMITR